MVALQYFSIVVIFLRHHTLPPTNKTDDKLEKQIYESAQFNEQSCFQLDSKNALI